jgi:hypothetical protein
MAGLDAVGKRRNPFPCRESKPNPPARSLVAMLTEVDEIIHDQEFVPFWKRLWLGLVLQ